MGFMLFTNRGKQTIVFLLLILAVALVIVGFFLAPELATIAVFVLLGGLFLCALWAMAGALLEDFGE
jgi:hypothetical protein